MRSEQNFHINTAAAVILQVPTALTGRGGDWGDHVSTPLLMPQCMPLRSNQRTQPPTLQRTPLPGFHRSAARRCFKINLALTTTTATFKFIITIRNVFGIRILGILIIAAATVSSNATVRTKVVGSSVLLEATPPKQQSRV